LLRRFERYFRHPDLQHNVLRQGDRAIACRNVRAALSMIDIRSAQTSDTADEELFDETLTRAVRDFQVRYHHRVADGAVGPGTRERLVSELLHRFSPSIFDRLHRTEGGERPSVFISYAWADTERVNKLDQWLRDNGVQVVRDSQFFIAGASIQENIAMALASADKILAVFSRASRDRDWPRLERALAEQVEARLGMPILIYLRIDDAELPAHDPTRLAIVAKDQPLREVGEQVLRAVTGRSMRAPTYAYDENQPL
jgi:hypothetical protein